MNTARKLSTRDHNAMAQRVSAGQDFTTHGALRGEVWKRDSVSVWDTGDMPRELANEFMIDHMNGISYVIFSYATPIGWKMNDGSVKVPDHRYSQTTSCHQTKAALALS